MSTPSSPFWTSEASSFQLRAYFPETSLVFADPRGDVVGRLKWEGGIFRFEGNADESSKVFFDALKRMGIGPRTNLTSSNLSNTKESP